MAGIGQKQTCANIPTLHQPMTTDYEIAIAVRDFQQRAKEIPLKSLPGYKEWSQAQLDNGALESLIDHLDGMTMTLLPEEIAQVSVDDFEELLDDLKAATGCE